ncbi:MAG TPA: helix-turn-helix domain-containing protein [Solirubrobacteraceae bacterium]|nr:helix-turn-helix domain-containing protein [Solirubrobacteraceae bacterium]
MTPPVKPPQTRTRRRDRGAATAQRITDAARDLFLERGYVPTTIEAIADRADVAVETVYARFRNKRALLVAVVEQAVTETGAVPLAERPELAGLAAEDDPRARVRLAARLSRGMLERVSPVYDLLRDAARVDDSLQEYVTRQVALRLEFQRNLIALLRRDGAFRSGLTSAAAADTYSALANPELFLLLTGHQGWTPAKYERWLGGALERLLLGGVGPGSER